MLLKGAVRVITSHFLLFLDFEIPVSAKVKQMTI